MKLLDAKNGIFKDMDGRDDFPFDMDRCGIIIRIHVGSSDHWSANNNSSLACSSPGIFPAPMSKGG